MNDVSRKGKSNYRSLRVSESEIEVIEIHSKIRTGSRHLLNIASSYSIVQIARNTTHTRQDHRNYKAEK